MTTILHISSNSTPCTDTLLSNAVEFLSLDSDGDEGGKKIPKNCTITEGSLPHVPIASQTYTHILYSHTPSADWDLTFLSTLTPSLSPLSSILLHFPTTIPPTVPTSLLLSGLQQSRQIKNPHGSYIITSPQNKIDLTATGMARTEVSTLKKSQPLEEKKNDLHLPNKVQITSLIDDLDSDLLLDDEDLLAGVPVGDLEKTDDCSGREPCDDCTCGR
ncbi:hypothetical protein TL16_g08562 [Triparma laevis f. inornata]|uniref:Uncharacterized protein n=1 Tax=Triparma laevis f. inornata TaxID=1714386 RepID=A0A9W7EGQ6_9STRA|nr:hypothetical protein TL16_g08562 [Triparma laevis f. inornata]